MGLGDRDALRTLRDAVDPDRGADELIRRFYTRWFAIDLSARDLFPPDMDAQRRAFAEAMTWLFGELIAQRAEEPVAFLAQLGRDHRKYGVTQRHYDTMQDALYTTLRSHLIESWDDKLAEAETRIGEGLGSRTAVVVNSAIIVFREGLEAVLILAALMASMVGAQRRLRRPLLGGVLVALVASAITWVVAQTVLGSLAGWGERLEAVVSLVAIGVLLLILNWFYHRVYWQENLQDLHKRKKRVLAGASVGILSAQALGLVYLTEDQLELQKWVHEFAANVVRPAAHVVELAGGVTVVPLRAW